MRWRPSAGRGQVIDRRGRGGLRTPGPFAARGGLGGLGLIGIVVAILFGSGVVGGGGGGYDIGPGLEPFPDAPAAQGDPLSGAPQDAELTEFVRFVVEDVQDTWARLFAEAGRRYEPTQLVLFRRGTSSGCGFASSQVGPFYCPADGRVYLDLTFFRELAVRFGAPGDFAQAYVIAHEFGHHVQSILGISGDVHRAQQENADEASELSVRLELQADCLAGVWAYTTYERNLLEPGDLEEGLAAASAVGDDRIQREATGRVDVENFTHGSSEQRTTWFLNGFESGDANECDTFSGDV